MVTVTCTNSKCVSHDVSFNFAGNPETVECGGCHVMLTPTDFRDDPELPEYIPPA
jgi:hypothetical protein